MELQDVTADHYRYTEFIRPMSHLHAGAAFPCFDSTATFRKLRTVLFHAKVMILENAFARGHTHTVSGRLVSSELSRLPDMGNCS